jgi:dihydroorotase
MAPTPDLLLRGGVILDASESSRTRADVLIRDGRIAEIGEGLSADGVAHYDCEGSFISVGWMDMHVHLREPGHEHKETIETGARAAAAGGFTAVACMPNTDPPIHTRDVVEFIIERARATAVDVYPIACVSKGRAGKELAEMADLVAGGAVAFSDDGSPVQDSGLMRRALEYSAMLDRPVINHMEDLTLHAHGQMHEGAVATRLGLAGIPALAEEVMIARDALIAEFTGGRIHVAHISTANAVDIVRRARKRGVAITAEVCAHHFALTDEEVERTNYSTNTKMHPPLRTAADLEAIKEGLRDGTIDAICTDHAPHASFEKETEFVAAPFGIIGLETAWGLVGRDLIAKSVLTLEECVRKVTVEPRRILRLANPEISTGAAANLTIFDGDTRWTFEARHIRSRSRNTPFVGSEMVGRAWAIYNKGQFVDNGAV